MQQAFGRRCRAAGLAAAVAALLSACAEESAVEGERFPVRSQDDAPVVREAEGRPLPAAEINDAWPQRGGTAARAGFHPAFAAERTVIWSNGSPSAAQSDWPFNAEPVVAGGRVFVLDGDTRLHAIDVGNGRTLWSVGLRPEGESRLEGVGGGISHFAGRLYVTSGFGEVVAVDPSDGGVLWRRSLPAPAYAAPVATEDGVAVVTRADQLLLLRADGGEELWEVQGPTAQYVYLEAAAPAVEGGAVVAPFSAGEVASVDLASGEFLWRSILVGGEDGSALAVFRDIKADPVIVDGLVVVGNRRGDFSAMSLSDGEVSWRLQTGAQKPAWVVPGSVFYLDSRAGLTRVNLDDGSLVWRRQLATMENPEDSTGPIFHSAPVLAGDLVLIGGTDERLSAYSAATGAPAWEMPLDAPLRTAPVVAGGVAYLFLENGTLVALR